jgi:hypothetical protein
MTEQGNPFDVARVAYEQGRMAACVCDQIDRAALAAAVQRVEALICTDCLQHLMADDGWATCFYCVGVWEALVAIKGGKQ